MKKKQKVDLIISIFLIILGIITSNLSKFKNINLPKVLFMIMIIYATLNMIKFILTKESKDYESIFTSILSYIIGFIGMSFNLFSNCLELSVTLFSWIMLMSIIKFKKCDYYNDRNNKIWIVKIISLVLFIISGVILCINLYYSKNIQILLIGIFFYINGILEIIDPFIIYLMESSK